MKLHKMKHKILYLVAGVAAISFSCNKIETDVPDRSGLAEILVYSSDAAKTSLDGSSVLWGTGDKLMVFSEGSTAGNVFTLGSGAGTGSGTFYGAEPAAGAGHYFAVYPSSATYNGSTKFTWILPAEVPYTKGTFAPGNSPMLSATKDAFDGTFTMKNLCGVMRLKLRGEIQVKRLELTFGNYVSGEGVAYRGNTSITMNGSSDADKKITMTCDSAVQLEPDSDTEFYFVLPPAEYDGFTITAVLPNNNKSTKTVSSSFTISRSAVTTVSGTMPAPALTSHPELKVWSFNIACQSNDDNSSWGSSHYWSARKDAVYAFFNTQNPDIVGTQECEYRQRVNILGNTSGYAAYGLGVDYGKESSSSSGYLWNKQDYNTDSSNAIFYKTEKFDILDKGTFWLSSNPSSVGSDDGHNCAWIKFRWKENGYVFYFFNTHFTAHYTEAAYAARKAECTILYDQITAINTENLPMIIVGDLNATTTNLFDDNGDSRLNNWYWARNQDGKTSKTAYPTSCNDFKVTYSGGSWSSDGTNIDHIAYKNFYNNSKHGLKAGSFDTDTYAYNGVTYISDHWPITATLVFDYQ